MATRPQPKPADMAALVDAASSKQMGVEPQIPQGGPQGGPAAPSSGDPQQITAADKAASKGSPTTEGDKIAAEPMTYNVKIGGQDRSLTDAQISGTFERYRDLNHKNAQRGKVNSIIDKMMANHPDMSQDQMAKRLEAMYLAEVKNAQLGGQDRNVASDPSRFTGSSGRAGAPDNNEGAVSNTQMSEDMEKWERDNAISLPPMYKNMIGSVGQGQQGINEMRQQLAQTQEMLRQVLGAGAGQAQASKEGMQQAQEAQRMASQKGIANNLDKVQQHLGIPDEAADDFMSFATMRGYSIEDFGDVNLAFNVMSDFKNNIDKPKADHAVGVAEKRAAYTGGLSSAPSAGGSVSTPEATTFDKFAASAMGKKGLV
jgi:hypothetical protein